MDDLETGGTGLATGPDLTAEAALLRIIQNCCAEIDAHLAYLLERDDPEGPHKARVWLRRLVVALDAFHPILKRRKAAAMRAEAKAIFRSLGKLRDRDVLMDGLTGAERSEKLVAETARIRERVRARLREDNVVLFAPQVLRMVEEGALFRTGAAALALRSGSVAQIATVALDGAWERCRKHKGEIGEMAPTPLHGFRKDLKTLRYLSEFFAPFLALDGAEPFRAELQRMQDFLGVATDAQVARSLGKKAAGKKHWTLVDRGVVRDALGQADAVWRAMLMHRPWWRGTRGAAVLH